MIEKAMLPLARMIEGNEAESATRNLEALQALHAFSRARMKARARWMEALISKGPRTEARRDVDSGVIEIAIDEIELLAADGRGAARLPGIPRSCARLWIEEYRRYSRGEQDREPFRVRLEGGRWALEGGMTALVRLEILREAGERTIAARARTVAAMPPRITALRPARGPIAGAAGGASRAAS